MRLLNNLTVKETAKLSWTIPEALDATRYKLSQDFSPPNSRRVFQLELSTKSKIFDLNHIFINLYYNGDESELFRYRVSILDSKGMQHYTKEYIWNYTSKPDYEHNNYNATNYIPLEKCKKFLMNNYLDIFCVVDILDAKRNVPSVQQADSLVKLSQNYEEFLESGKLSDFMVMVGSREFRVHKTILAAQSNVFTAMFQHCTTKEMKEGRVVIEDMAVEVFEALIRYIYTAKIESLVEYAAELLVAADRYQLDHLKAICEKSLISTIDTNSASSILLLSDMHNAQQLKSKCIDYIVNNWKEVKDSDTWKKEIKGKRADLIEKILDSSATTN